MFVASTFDLLVSAMLAIEMRRDKTCEIQPKTISGVPCKITFGSNVAVVLFAWKTGDDIRQLIYDFSTRFPEGIEHLIPEEGRAYEMFCSNASVRTDFEPGNRGVRRSETTIVCDGSVDELDNIGRLIVINTEARKGVDFLFRWKVMSPLDMKRALGANSMDFRTGTRFTNRSADRLSLLELGSIVLYDPHGFHFPLSRGVRTPRLLSVPDRELFMQESLSRPKKYVRYERYKHAAFLSGDGEMMIGNDHGKDITIFDRRLFPVWNNVRYSVGRTCNVCFMTVWRYEHYFISCPATHRKAVSTLVKKVWDSRQHNLTINDEFIDENDLAHAPFIMILCQTCFGCLTIADLSAITSGDLGVVISVSECAKQKKRPYLRLSDHLIRSGDMLLIDDAREYNLDYTQFDTKNAFEIFHCISAVSFRKIMKHKVAGHNVD